MNYAARLDRLRSEIASQSLDALLVTSEINVRYLTGFTGDSTYLLVHAEGETLLSDRRYETQLQQECPDLEALVRGPDRTMLQLVEQALEKWAGNQRVGLEADHVSWADQTQFAAAAGSSQLQPTSGLVEAIRCIKDEAEIAILRRAVWIAERTFEGLQAQLRPGWTELEMAHEVESLMRRLGASGCGFAPILAVDANAALPHAHPGRQTLDQAEVLLVDWGAKYQGYTSDLTRTLSIGPPSDKFRQVYQVVLEAQQAAIDAMAPGVALAEVDAAARQVIADAGFGEYFGHGLGHGIGLQVHEFPRMASISKGTLEAGMVVTVEPGIYLPGQFGVRIEDDVLITAGGHEVLSELAKGLEDCTVIL
ncbi:M24 family metallopeptidase [Roseimaritima ulvae]|uniref:Putative peptidase n=1 Tax=Roseimaritima ulvae TaxID=980254 RepID=A0A5B9QHQ4_9BACT|nr:Xaa-Pro peptidase family protein [Roseimaritima ulvae]QEG38374.1 putative peptidase [Roseimaritima ulvae]